MQRRVQAESESAMDSRPARRGTNTLAVGCGALPPLFGCVSFLQDCGVCRDTHNCQRCVRILGMKVQFASYVERIESLPEPCDRNGDRYSEDENHPDFTVYSTYHFYQFSVSAVAASRTAAGPAQGLGPVMLCIFQGLKPRHLTMISFPITVPITSPEITISTRRFCCRPCAVSLEATG